MDKINMTDAEIRKLPFAEKGKQVDYYDRDLDGFGLRVSATSKRYFVRMLVDGKRTRVMMQNFNHTTAQAARKEAKAKLGDLSKGIDLNEQKRQMRQQAEEARQRGVTLQEALDQYLNKGKLKPRTLTTYRQIIHLYLGDWLDKPAPEITRDMVRDRHREIASGQRQRRKLVKSSTTPVEANMRREAAADNCMRTLRAILNYAFEDEESETIYRNPVDILSSRKHKAWFKPARRQTFIKNSDLPAWYRAVMALDNDIMRDYMRFLLFTGLRRQEAATLQWRQVDFNERCFTVVDTKNSDPHTLPLSDHLWQLLQDRKKGLSVKLADAKAALGTSKGMTLKQQQAAFNRVALAESRLASPFIFPGEGKTGHIVEPKKAIGSITASTGITFTLHDLRRTFATIAESLDLSGYTIKALLNHRQQLSDVTGGYIILGADRLREPMQRITDTILERTRKQHGQVVPFQRVAEGQ